MEKGARAAGLPLVKPFRANTRSCCKKCNDHFAGIGKMVVFRDLTKKVTSLAE